ncbi:MAG: HAMP domain-containing histidine kinase [Lachnospiraceae bacterium]|nr:HAMP domain-containing histidine kinase [Lachnospiraceae bacterium]
MNEKGKSKKDGLVIIDKMRKKEKIKEKRKQRVNIMRKPSFRRILAKYMAIGFCVALFIGCVGTYIAVSYYRSVGYKDFVIHTNRMGENILDAYTSSMEKGLVQEDAISSWKSTVRWNLNTKRVMGYEACLYDVSTKEKFVEQKCVGNIVFREIPPTESDMGVRHILECDCNVMKETITDYNNWFEERGVEADDLDTDVPWLEVKDFYFKGGLFVPGKVELQINDGYGVTNVLKKYDYTPKDITGYRYISLQDDSQYGVLGPIWFLEPNQDVGCELIEDYIERAGDMEDKEEIWMTSYSEDHRTFWGVQALDSEIITVDDGKEYLLVVAADINFWKAYKEWIIVAYLAVFVLSIFIMVPVAYSTYMKRWNHYQLDSYRRETTNAMAHDLKTPLMAISGYAENLRNNVHTEKKDYYADLIMEHVAYMNGMVENILELAKVENISQVSERTSVDLKECTQKILKKYEILTTDKNIWVNIEGSCEIGANQMRMEQALENLISNAIKYAPADTEIHIKLDKNFYEVRNQLEEKLESSVEELWKPFVKGDNSRNEQRGTGIGLTIVKNIADVHGFELVLRCEEEEFVAKILF